MTPPLVIRPVMAAVAALCLAGCGADPHRFETLAESVAAIPLDGGSATSPRAPSVERVRVEVMEPHDLWDARERGLRGVIGDAAPKMIEAAAPAVAQAVVEQAIQRAPRVTGLRPALPAPVKARAEAHLVQLGAFGSEDGARAAWSRLSSKTALASLQPVYERIDRDGRPLVRLKVAAPAAQAAAVCAAAGIDDPWCRRAA